jgi:hypothetical protein
VLPSPLGPTTHHAEHSGAEAGCWLGQPAAVRGAVRSSALAATGATAVRHGVGILASASCRPIQVLPTPQPCSAPPILVGWVSARYCGYGSWPEPKTGDPGYRAMLKIVGKWTVGKPLSSCLGNVLCPEVSQGVSLSLSLSLSLSATAFGQLCVGEAWPGGVAAGVGRAGPPLPPPPTSPAPAAPLSRGRGRTPCLPRHVWSTAAPSRQWGRGPGRGQARAGGGCSPG